MQYWTKCPRCGFEHLATPCSEKELEELGQLQLEAHPEVSEEGEGPESEEELG